MDTSNSEIADLNSVRIWIFFVYVASCFHALEALRKCDFLLQKYVYGHIKIYDTDNILNIFYNTWKKKSTINASKLEKRVNRDHFRINCVHRTEQGG
jgi:hypothetical protein